jgi:uncharacterized repeat protein (TIGR03847 family)
MSPDIELDPVDKITIGAVGEPGQRTFYLQVQGNGKLVTFLIEKQQAVELARVAHVLLVQLGRPVDLKGWDSPSMDIVPGEESQWRVGAIAIGYDEGRDLVVLECTEIPELATETAPESLADPEEDLASARFLLTRDQMALLAARASYVSAQGRPACPFCGMPLEPEGHRCFATNGHR